MYTLVCIKLSIVELDCEERMQFFPEQRGSQQMSKIDQQKKIFKVVLLTMCRSIVTLLTILDLVEGF